MINIKQLQKYIDTLNEEKCIDFIYQSVKDLKIDYNRRKKMLDKEFNDGYMVSRAKSTTNYANTYKSNKSYLDSKDYLLMSIRMYERKF